ncbi:hypothetical protein TFKS16_3021 [Tannerella forsythia KS16]|jgi:Domain of Unknown Function (DUF1080).|uniref:DUF1080 domain-containing protein n=1 Tax=Tannerella forsythia TaxID=28112 RepID=A0A1D3UXE7_TANFO|nr:DUF1080 domain-containing protein [Tannerella forsythia]KKY61247.1 hypothetical protein Tanf_08090 [Tannerella forsythia]OLQ21016.1 hypothetical protein BGK60_12845 [Tannerella forsythia]PDP42951.1 DUF1080 domain-containing protein [Tannerella forsythia]PDP70595.1 DUF1080 domain-containing protein [Tannerella forsythia]TPE17118.1 DUF1080 domain-containing protein [Tannerella forsythia]
MKRKNFLLSVIVAACMTAGSSHAQTEILFNGSDLSNWNFVVADGNTPAEDVFSVQDGVILIQGNPFGYMYTKKKYADFTLEVEWAWVDKPSNSGIFLMISDPKTPFPNGIECQLHAGDAGDFILLEGADLAEYKQPAGEERPKFPVVKKRADSNEKPVGEWNRAKIDVKNGVIKVYINDLLQNTGTSNVKEGYLGLQSEGGLIQFRTVKVTPAG